MASQQVALVTGASSGFGRLTAEAFAGRGWRAYAAIRDVDYAQHGRRNRVAGITGVQNGLFSTSGEALHDRCRHHRPAAHRPGDRRHGRPGQSNRRAPRPRRHEGRRRRPRRRPRRGVVAQIETAGGLPRSSPPTSATRPRSSASPRRPATSTSWSTTPGTPSGDRPRRRPSRSSTPHVRQQRALAVPPRRGVRPAMATRGAGSIVNISNMAGRIGLPTERPRSHQGRARVADPGLDGGVQPSRRAG